MADPTPDPRLERLVARYAELGVRPIDARATAQQVLGGGQPARGGAPAWPRRRLLPVLASAAGLAIVLGAAIVGNTLLDGARQAGVGASPVPVASPRALPCVQMGDPSGSSVEELARPFHSTLASAGKNGALVIGGGPSSRFDPTTDPIQLLAPDDRAAFPDLVAVRAPEHGTIVPSPDGIALAIEQGDLGPGGCGDPVVLMAGGGRRRPFPVGAYTTVRGMAWAPDHSALYAVRRPTLDPTGTPYEDEMTGDTDLGPGTVLRWDTATGQVTDLGSPCGRCPRLFVSPDGTRLAVSAGDAIALKGPDDSWQLIRPGVESSMNAPVGDGLVGWADDASLVWSDSWHNGGARLALDGTVIVRWDQPCGGCGGFDRPVLSPDGRTLAGTNKGASEGGSLHVRTVDVFLGTVHDVWAAPMGCMVGDSGCDWLTKRPTSSRPDPVDPSNARVLTWAPDARRPHPGRAGDPAERNGSAGGAAARHRMDGTGGMHALPIDGTRRTARCRSPGCRPSSATPRRRDPGAGTRRSGGGADPVGLVGQAQVVGPGVVGPL
ncbi:MAG: hypothetical protein U0869_10715 [Chloroflexota bacterium]